MLPEQREYLRLIRSSGESLLEIIDDILCLSKIDARKMDLNPIEFSLRDCVSEACKTVAVQAHRKDLELICEVAEGCPEYLLGDSGRVKQILLNLMGNAVKFTERGEIRVRAEVEWDFDSFACVRFSVRDTGIGIPADKHLRPVHTSRRIDYPQIRRHGSRPDHLREARANDGWFDVGREHGWSGQHVLLHRLAG